MQLIQIGAIQQKTVRDMILETANRQFDEIVRLKRLAFARRTAAAGKRPLRCNPRSAASK